MGRRLGVSSSNSCTLQLGTAAPRAEQTNWGVRAGVARLDGFQRAALVNARLITGTPLQRRLPPGPRDRTSARTKTVLSDPYLPRSLLRGARDCAARQTPDSRISIRPNQRPREPHPRPQAHRRRVRHTGSAALPAASASGLIVRHWGRGNRGGGQACLGHAFHLACTRLGRVRLNSASALGVTCIEQNRVRAGMHLTRRFPQRGCPSADG